MSAPSKTLERTAVLEGWTNRPGRRALREILEAYTDMLVEMLKYAVESGAPQATLHRTFYPGSGRGTRGCRRGVIKRRIKSGISDVQLRA
ncbi:MAG: hypothetical protein ACP5HK_04520 [Acidilobus sp.]